MWCLQQAKGKSAGAARLVAVGASAHTGLSPLTHRRAQARRRRLPRRSRGG